MTNIIKRICDKAVTQAKKDAKRLSRSQNIPHHEALDVIARKLGFPSWAQAMRHQESNSTVERMDSINYCIPGDEGIHLTLSPYAPIGYLIGYSGSGKTLLLRHMCLEYLKAGRKVVIAGIGDPCEPFYDIKTERGVLSFIGYTRDDKRIDLAGIMADHSGSIIIFDEFWQYKNLSIPSDPNELKALCNLHNCYFLATSQTATDFSGITNKDYPPIREKNNVGLRYVAHIGFVLHFIKDKSNARDIIGAVENGDYKNLFRVTSTKKSFNIQDDGGVGYAGTLHLKNSEIESSKVVPYL